MTTRRQFAWMAFGGLVSARRAISALAGSGEGGDVRRVGVRRHGVYWGAAGERIDLLSVNLSLSLPLLQANSRGCTLNIAWSYNSQLWRMDSGGIQAFGPDTGFGFGWQVQAGSIAPVPASGS